MSKRSIAVMMALSLLPLGMQAQRIHQKLARSVVAVNRGSNVLVSWRKLAQEPEGTVYNLYRRTAGATDYTKVNASPLSLTNYSTTTSAMPYNTEFAVAPVINGVEGEKSSPFLFKQQAYSNVFFDFNFETSLLTPNDYRAKYAWPMDLNGDGAYDAVLVDRLAVDNAANTHKLQAYTLDGTCLWTVDMGPNVIIDSGQNDMVTVYDINCDGKCEVIIKSSDGTRFWDAANKTWGTYAFGKSTSDTDGDGITDYRTQRVKNPPFYISVIDGATGAELTSSELKYADVHDGVDQYSRTDRSNYMSDGDGTEYAFMGGHFAICYDGVRPYVIMECLDRTTDKTHHNYVFAFGYDWNNGVASNFHHFYTWSRNDKTPWPAEFHQLRVADTDGNGRDEMLQGGYGVNPWDNMVYSAGIGHGDRFIVSDIDPERPGLEVYAIQQSALLGQLTYDAATGEHIKEWYLPSVYDVGRGECLDCDSTRKGYEIYSFVSDYIYDCKGEKTDALRPYPCESSWWDGDLLREQISSPGGKNYSTNTMITTVPGGNRLIEFSKESGWTVHAGTGVRPAYMGDMTGDWREEIIQMKQTDDISTGLIGYSTDIATPYSIYCLQEDPHYHLDCTTRGYYQSPNTDFYLGHQMPKPPVPPTMVTDLRWKSGDITTGCTTYDQTAAQNYADGKSILFDISGANSTPISLTGAMKPKAVYVMNPKGHDYTFSGTGTLDGEMTLTKSMQGTATFNNDFNFTGNTIVSEGRLNVNGKIKGPVELRAKGTLGGNPVLNGAITFEGALNYEGCRLMPGTTDEPYGTMTVNHDLTLPGNVYIEETLNTTDAKNGKLVVNGNLTLEGDNIFTINLKEAKPVAGEYVLAECTGTMTADVTKILTRGLDGLSYQVEARAHQLVLVINKTRAAAKDVKWTGTENGQWDYQTSNFTSGGTASTFVTGDEVTFNDEAVQRNITVGETMMANATTFDFSNGTYHLTGEGGIGGTGTVTKKGSGELLMDLQDNSFTGAMNVNGGTLTVYHLADGGTHSDIGAAAATAGLWNMGKGTLKMAGDNQATDRVLTLTGDTATINVQNASASLSLKGKVTGSGYLLKDGAGQLNFNYGGTNTFAGMIVRKGIVAQGAWNTSFGNIGSPMLLCGGEVNLIDINNMSTIPTFDYVTTVQEGTSSIIRGTTRGTIRGKFLGKGDLTIYSTGVRSDIYSDFSQFEGTLHAQGGNFRLMSNVTDMSKTHFVLENGAYVTHTVGGSNTNQSTTTKLGSLSSPSASATDATLGNGIDAFEIGYNNEDTGFYGMLKAQSIKKVGTGTLSIYKSSSTSAVNVAGGNLEILNTISAMTPFSTGAVNVSNGGTLCGYGCVQSVTAGKGATVMASTKNGLLSTLKCVGDMTMNSGSTLQVYLKTYGNSKYNVGGTLTHNADTIKVIVADDRVLQPGDEINVFVTNINQKGSYILTTEAPGRVIEWDDSTLMTDGKLKVKSMTTGVDQLMLDSSKLVDIYELDGTLYEPQVQFGRILPHLPRGMYIVDHQKILKQ